MSTITTKSTSFKPWISSLFSSNQSSEGSSPPSPECIVCRPPPSFRDQPTKRRPRTLGERIRNVFKRNKKSADKAHAIVPQRELSQVELATDVPTTVETYASEDDTGCNAASAATIEEPAPAPIAPVQTMSLEDMIKDIPPLYTPLFESSLTDLYPAETPISVRDLTSATISTPPPTTPSSSTRPPSPRPTTPVEVPLKQRVSSGIRPVTLNHIEFEEALEKFRFQNPEPKKPFQHFEDEMIIAKSRRASAILPQINDAQTRPNIQRPINKAIDLSQPPLIATISAMSLTRPKYRPYHSLPAIYERRGASPTSRPRLDPSAFDKPRPKSTLAIMTVKVKPQASEPKINTAKVNEAMCKAISFIAFVLYHLAFIAAIELYSRWKLVVFVLALCGIFGRWICWAASICLVLMVISGAYRHWGTIKMVGGRVVDGVARKLRKVEASRGKYV